MNPSDVTPEQIAEVRGDLVNMPELHDLAAALFVVVREEQREFYDALVRIDSGKTPREEF